jgi:hypothetical protein
MTTTRPDFSVAADETSYRRLGAVIREEIYRIVKSSYSFGTQSESGLVRLDQAQSALNAARDRIYSKIESLLMVIDVLAEMKDVNVVNKGETLKVERRNRNKVNHAAVAEAVKTLQETVARENDPTVDNEAQDLVDRVLAGLSGGES